MISYKGPTTNIYHFEGVYELGLNTKTEPLFLEHTLWADTKITSGKAIGLVLYTGRETRIVMNSREPRSKAGKLEIELNFITKVLFILMVILSGCITVLNGMTSRWYIQFFRYMLLIASVIPISLRVNLDFAKLIFANKINKDETIPGTITRNSDIPEELGRISYLLTDKTGTLTKNEMYFKKLVLEHGHFGVENIGQIAKGIKTHCERAAGIAPDSADSKSSLNVSSILDSSMDLSRSPGRSPTTQSIRRATMRREKENVLRDFATAISVCHNVTPVVENGQQVLHASSPDEIALVNFAQDLKMKLISRTNEKITLENPIGQKEEYRILALFPFSSETKRMGILVRSESNKKIVFFLKGADTAISPKV